MSVNKYKPHLYVIPEDDRDRQIADGFVLHGSVDARQAQVMPPPGGWRRVMETFKMEYQPLLRQNQNTHVVLLIDFDGHHEGRREEVEIEIPVEFRSRVFVIGPRETPEDLRQSLGKSWEDIGRTLADECDRDRVDVWMHEQLCHNEIERTRLVQTIRPFLFGQRGR